MLRRIVIIFVSAVAALALAAAPAGAGAGNLELYSLPNYTGTQASVTPGTLTGYVNQCVTTTTLTGSVLTQAKSAQNFSSHTVELYYGTGCNSSTFIRTLTTNTSWSMASGGQATTYVYVVN
jgi:hypothetical protein